MSVSYVLFFFYVSFQIGSHPGQAETARFALPLYVFFCVISSLFFNTLINYKNCFFVIILVCIIANIPESYLFVNNFVNASSEHSVSAQASQWIQEHVPQGTSVGILPHPAPYKCPPFKFSAYTIQILDKEIYPEFIFLRNEKLVKNFPDYSVEKIFEARKKIGNFTVIDNTFFVNRTVFILKKNDNSDQ